MSLNARKPLLAGDVQASSRLYVQICFGLLGLASSVLWNQLMLCVEPLTQLFGHSALARAAAVQNASCALAMGVLTLGQRLMPLRTARLLLCGLSLCLMLCLACPLAAMLHSLNGSEHSFLAIVALNGLCTGMSQNLAAAASTMYPGASGALLLGESMAPLAAVFISTASELALKVPEQAAATLFEAQAFVMAAVGAVWAVSRLPPQQVAGQTVAQCLVEDGGREYLLSRMTQLTGNSLVAFLCCTTWVFLLCASPFISDGLCSDCPGLARRMLSVANLAATLGRLAGLKVGTKPWLPALVLESLMLLAFGMLVIFACIQGHLLAQSRPAALAMGLSISGGITAWCNFLLMRNDHSGQQSCGHSVLLPCHVTTELMWLAIQLGSIAGTALAAWL